MTFFRIGREASLPEEITDLKVEVHDVDATERGVYCMLSVYGGGLPQSDLIIRFDKAEKESIPTVTGAAIIFAVTGNHKVRDMVLNEARSKAREIFPEHFFDQTNT